MRTIGSMNKLSMEVVLNTMRRRESALRNEQLRAALQRARAAGCGTSPKDLRGLNEAERLGANFA